MFSLLSGALLPINAPDNPVFDEFQKAAAHRVRPMLKR
ncbi:MAG: hypothetical protein OJF48_003515 [Afipia sp.]|nr:MAG: hypothetical protein OJF48_003515 [Afipia sp.]